MVLVSPAKQSRHAEVLCDSDSESEKICSNESLLPKRIELCIQELWEVHISSILEFHESSMWWALKCADYYRNDGLGDTLGSVGYFASWALVFHYLREAP